MFSYHVNPHANVISFHSFSVLRPKTKTKKKNHLNKFPYIRLPAQISYNSAQRRLFIMRKLKECFKGGYYKVMQIMIKIIK